MRSKPFYQRVSRELDAMERRSIMRSAAAMVVGGLFCAAVALAAYVIL